MNFDPQIWATEQQHVVLVVPNFEGTESQKVQKGRSSRRLLAVLHRPVLFNLVCWSINFSTKREWSANSYETGADGTNVWLLARSLDRRALPSLFSNLLNKMEYNGEQNARWK